MDRESSRPGHERAAVEALRRAGALRTALGFFAMCTVSVLAADAILGSRGWGAGQTGGAGGVGVAFAWIWAYLVWSRLDCRRPWGRALLEAFLPAIVVIALIVAMRRMTGW